MDDRWLSMKEICAYLGVSHDTISRWIANYNMPSMKMGKCWKFKKDQIEGWLAKGGPEKRKKRTKSRACYPIKWIKRKDQDMLLFSTENDFHVFLKKCCRKTGHIA